MAKMFSGVMLKVLIGIAVTLVGGLLLAYLLGNNKPRIALREAAGAVIFVFAFGLLAMIFGAILIPYRMQWITAVLAGLSLLMLVTVLFFFRDPDRITKAEAGEIFAPADGVIDLIDDNTSINGIPGKAKRISMFLSLFNVHVQRMPVSGKIRRIEYVKGKVLPAFLGESSEKNRHNVYYIDGDIPVVIKQISGIVAQRPVSWVKEGQELKAGDRLGLIKFGSRVDIYVPISCDILVDVDTDVKGGITKIAIKR